MATDTPHQADIRSFTARQPSRGNTAESALLTLGLAAALVVALPLAGFTLMLYLGIWQGWVGLVGGLGIGLTSALLPAAWRALFTGTAAGIAAVISFSLAMKASELDIAGRFDGELDDYTEAVFTLAVVAGVMAVVLGL